MGKAGGFTQVIEALEILRKYRDPAFPFHCEHDILYVVGIDPNEVSDEDKGQLDELGFFVMNEWGEEMFASYKWGSA